MARFEIDDSVVRVRLSLLEKIWSLRGDLTVTSDQIVHVQLWRNPFEPLRGVRAPGLAIPYLIKVGRWRHRQGTDFNVIRRGQPAVAVVLADHRYARLLIGDDDAAAVAERLRSLGL